MFTEEHKVEWKDLLDFNSHYYKPNPANIVPWMMAKIASGSSESEDNISFQREINDPDDLPISILRKRILNKDKPVLPEVNNHIN